MRKSIVLGLMVAGCVNNQSSTATQQQSVDKHDSVRADDDPNGRVLSVDVKLAGGGTFTLTATQLDPDPIYMMYGTIKGDVTSDGHTNKDIEIRAIASGPTAGATLATGTAAVAGILTSSVSPQYASDSAPMESVSINFTKISFQYQQQDPQTRNQVSAVASGAAILAGGPAAANVFNDLTPTFGLASPCTAGSCDRLLVTYDVEQTLKLGDRVQLVVHDALTGAPVEGAAVTVCFAGAAGPLTVVTDANGVAPTGAPGGSAITSVSVVATIGDQQVACQKGTSCDVPVQ
jgi:type VI protein secretion system component Hcp